jgi:hypothetical protein
MTNHTDSKGRTPADRIAAVQRGGSPVTDKQRADATTLLAELLAAAERHGVTIDDWDWVADLPGACLDVTLSQARKRGER